MPPPEPSVAVYHDLKDKVVVITGGANGIGQAMVRRFVDQGARVRFCDTDSDAGKSLESDTAKQALFSRVDLTKENRCDPGSIESVIVMSGSMFWSTAPHVIHELP